jgi:mannitol/fructose-specific phosphotransferase system IIA component
VGPLPAEPGTVARVLAPGSVRLGQRATDKWDVLRRSAAVLEEAGAVAPGYGDAMVDRENSVSTYLGEGVAIPHGTNESRALVHRTALGFLQFPDGVDWGLENGERVVIAIPIAASGNEHVGLLAALAEILVDPDKAQALRTASDPSAVLAVLAGGEDGDPAAGSGGDPVARAGGGPAPGGNSDDREGVVT